MSDENQMPPSTKTTMNLTDEVRNFVPNEVDDKLERLYDSLESMEEIYSLTSDIGIFVMKTSVAGAKKRSAAPADQSPIKRLKTSIEAKGTGNSSGNTKMAEPVSTPFPPSIENMVDAFLDLQHAHQVFKHQILETIQEEKGEVDKKEEGNIKIEKAVAFNLE